MPNEYAPVLLGRVGGILAGVDCGSWNETGEPVIDSVVTKPMPSMQIYVWRDPEWLHYNESYFNAWPGVWRHGDWVTMHADGSITAHGRSDATLNRQGRLGSADFYGVLETMPEISEAIVVGLDLPKRRVLAGPLRRSRPRNGAGRGVENQDHRDAAHQVSQSVPS